MPLNLDVKPEEVALCVLVHFFVHPPERSTATGEALSGTHVSRKLATFLLKHIKVRSAVCAPLPTPRETASPNQRIILNN